MESTYIYCYKVTFITSGSLLNDVNKIAKSYIIRPNESSLTYTIFKSGSLKIFGRMTVADMEANILSRIASKHVGIIQSFERIYLGFSSIIEYSSDDEKEQ